VQTNPSLLFAKTVLTIRFFVLLIITVCYKNPRGLVDQGWEKE
jgi:hypothetical protein